MPRSSIRSPGSDWVCEIKFDGYRLPASVEGDPVHCFTRNGNDWSDELPKLVAAIRERKFAPCRLDGEIVPPDPNGPPDFQRLQHAFDANRTGALTYPVFDPPLHDGADLRSQALTARRDRLQALLWANSQPLIRFSRFSPGTRPLFSPRHAKPGSQG